MPTYNITLGDSTTAESGDEGDNWIFFICGDVEDIFLNNNTRTITAGHVIFEVKIGKIDQKYALRKCVIFELGDSGDDESKYYNGVKKFLIESCLSDGDTLYLHVYEPIGSGSTDYVRFLDGNDDWQDYLKVRVSGFRFRFSAQKRVFEGQIMLEEVTE